MEKVWLSDKALAERYSVTRITIWRWSRKNPDFPKPHKIGANATRWYAPDVDAYDQRMREASK